MKRALVTGASKGLGLHTALELARMGHEVHLSARSLDKAEAAVAAHREPDMKLVAVELDPSDASSVAALFAGALRDTHLDILVNNAGTIFDGNRSTLDVEAESILRSFENNALSAHRMMLAVLPGMNERGYGRVVNVSSGMGVTSDMGSGWPGYRISKAAMNAMTVLCAHEARGDVKVNAICPGWVRTDMGGAGASRSIEESVPGIVWAATLDADGPNGGFFRDGEPIDF